MSALSLAGLVLLAMVNHQRVAISVQPLQTTANLEWIAQWRAEDMQARRYFSHHIPPLDQPVACGSLIAVCPTTGPYVFSVEQGLDMPYQVSGEIIESQAGTDSDMRAVTDWANKPDHRAIMLGSGYHYGGAAHVSSPAGAVFVVEVAA